MYINIHIPKRLTLMDSRKPCLTKQTMLIPFVTIPNMLIAWQNVPKRTDVYTNIVVAPMFIKSFGGCHCWDVFTLTIVSPFSNSRFVLCRNNRWEKLRFKFLCWIQRLFLCRVSDKWFFILKSYYIYNFRMAGISWIGYSTANQYNTAL